MKKIFFLLLILFLKISFADAQWLYTDLQPTSISGSWLLGISATDQVGHSWGLCCTALRWQGSASSYIELNGWEATATDGYRQAGNTSVSGRLRACTWTGTPGSRTLLPLISGATKSGAMALWNGRFGGWSSSDTSSMRATYWPSTSNVVLLHPSGYGSSVVNGITAGFQAGVVDGHAALWSGTAQSFVDMHPTGYDESTIYGIYGYRAVGYATISWERGTTSRHAGYWELKTGTFYDLHPDGYSESVLTGVSIDWASGWIELDNGVLHAAVWNLHTGNVTDLHNFLPVSYGVSQAFTIWRGAGTYVGGAASVSPATHAIMWYIPPD